MATFAHGATQSKRSRPISLFFWRASVIIVLMLTGSCAAMHKLGLWSAPGIESFHGVSFGETFYDVQMRYPAAAPETSPYGAQALRLSGVENDGIRYEAVIYEFAYKTGMQLVMASFNPTQAGAIHHWIAEEIVPPSLSGGSGAASSGISTWTTLNGETVILNAQSHWLAILGPKGQPLRPDIKLRELNARSAS